MKKKALSREDVLHLVKLSKLHLSPREVDTYWKQLEDTVEYVNNLEELKTDNINVTAQTTNIKNVGFEDGTVNSRQLSQEEATKNSKDKRDGYFSVKRVL